jgi:hypothetical protein
MSRHIRLQPSQSAHHGSADDLEPVTVDLRLAEITAATAAVPHPRATRPALRLPRWDPLPPGRR